MQHNSKKNVMQRNYCALRTFATKSAEKIDCSQLKQKKMNNSLIFQSVLRRKRFFFLVVVVVTEWWPKRNVFFYNSSNSLHLLLENPANGTKNEVLLLFIYYAGPTNFSLESYVKHWHTRSSFHPLFPLSLCSPARYLTEKERARCECVCVCVSVCKCKALSLRREVSLV